MAASVLVEPVTFGGWSNNLKLSNADVELIITLDVGPRIIHFAPRGQKNVFAEIAADMGGRGEDSWKLRGGHRLWTSPEDPVRTYRPDNQPVAHEIERAPGQVRVRVTTPGDTDVALEKTIEVSLGAQGSDVVVTHRLRNVGTTSHDVALWALSVMAPGGVAVVPLPGNSRHPGNSATVAAFAPHLTMSFWPYFQFGDPRVTFGRKYLKVRQDASLPSTKLGLAHRSEWAGYWNAGVLFVKQFSYEEGARYPDGGANFECYTDGAMLELETLSPLATLRPGAAATHTETWALHQAMPAPDTDETIANAWPFAT